MDLGLYINVLLTPEAALKGSAIKPMYPRRHGPLDARRKADVFRLSLASMRPLPIRRIIANIEAAGEFAASLPDVQKCLRDCFPDAEIVTESKRPTTLAAHKLSLEFAEAFFGPTMPIIAVYNHDHIFVDYRTEPFVSLVAASFGDGRNPSSYLVYSHAPEAISHIHDSSASHIRSVCFFGSRPAQTVARIGTNCWSTTTAGNAGLDSIFVTTVRGLKMLWNAILPNEGYLPRADWPGTKFDGTRFTVLSSPREFFRHFDGYGHVTALRGGYALGLDGFGPDCRRSRLQLPPVFGGSRETPEDCALDAQAEGYAGMFFELTALAGRDFVYASMVKNVHRATGFKLLETLFELFSVAYLDDPGELAHLSEAERHELRLLVRHKVFSRAVSFEAELLADCHLYGALMMNQALMASQQKSA